MDRLDKQMDDEGKFPKEMERTIALHYSAFDLEAFFLIAKMAEKVGIDFWNYVSPTGKSLQKAFNFQRPYLMNEKQWAGQQIKDFDFEEDAFPILMTGGAKYNCADCKEAVKKLAGERGDKLRMNLLY
jgi:hypothetical protein